MKDDIQTLPDDPELLKKLLQENATLLAEKEALLNQKDERIAYLLEQFHRARHRQFGASSEAYDGQGDLFNEAEEVVQEAEEKNEDVTVSSHTRKRNRPPLPPHLPRKEVYLDIPEEEKVCPCGEAMHKIGEERSEKLTFIPAKVEVTVYIRPKYVCRSHEKQGESAEIKIATLPASPIPKSIATPSLLAQIITAKYRYALPLNRQEVMFRQSGIELPRKQMAQWMMTCAEYLKRLYELLKQIQLQQPVIHVDETTTKVVNESNTLSYMWAYCTGADSPPKDRPPPDNETDKQTQKRLKDTPFRTWDIPSVVLFEYQSTREGEQHAKPLLDDLKAWLDKSALQVPKKTGVGPAIHYALNQWHKVIRYIDKGYLQIDNNRAERAIRPFTVGRKNWLYSQTARGANASAILYSIVQTAMSNGLDPYLYLEHLFKELPARPQRADINDLLPWNVTLAPE